MYSQSTVHSENDNINIKQYMSDKWEQLSPSIPHLDSIVSYLFLAFSLASISFLYVDLPLSLSASHQPLLSRNPFSRTAPIVNETSRGIAFFSPLCFLKVICTSARYLPNHLITL